MKILINEDGITGRAKNPMDASDMKFSPEWDKFETNVKSYTVIGSCKAGDVVECDLVWQVKVTNMSGGDIRWKTVGASDSRWAHRQAYQIVEAKPESKPINVTNAIGVLMSDDTYLHAVIKRKDEIIESLKTKIAELEAERFELLNNPNHKIT